MYEEYLKFAEDIAEKAKKIMLKYFNTEKEERYKYDNTIVTKADKEINDYLISKVAEKYPTHCVKGEEKESGDSNYMWICDPIDGTAMFAREIPVAVFSLAFVIDGEPVIGLVMDPFTNTTYESIKGYGTFENGKKINVSNTKLDYMKTVCNIDIWPYSEYEICDMVKELVKKTYVVSIGSVIRASMCVANGKFTAAIFPGTINKFYDIAAVKVIVEEAGGKVTDLFGNNQRYDNDINGALITNGIVHEELLELVNKYVNKKESI